MAAPVFGKTWYSKSKEEHAEAMEEFKAAVATARQGSDEAVKQVCEFGVEKCHLGHIS